MCAIGSMLTHFEIHYPLCRPIPGIIWTRMKCHSCHVNGIAGTVWRCANCLDYYLCTLCYMADKHSPEHAFLRIDTEDKKNRYAWCLMKNLIFSTCFWFGKWVSSINWEPGLERSAKGWIRIIDPM